MSLGNGDITFVAGVPSRGRWPLTFMRGEEVLLADRLDPFKADEIKATVKRLTKAYPGAKHLADKLTVELLQLAKPKPQSDPPKPLVKDDATTLLAAMPEHVRKDAADQLARPTLIEDIKAEICAMGVAGDDGTALGVYLIGVSRLLDRPLAGIVRGASSSGKSFAISTVARLFPPESKLESHHLSPKALYYLDDGALEHKFVVAGERARRQDDDSADATKAMREMLSDGILRACVVETVDGRLKSVPFEKRGPIAFVESTSASSIFAEDANRCLVFHVDESEGQTRRIIDAAAAAAAGKPNQLDKLIVPVHHAMQRMLKTYKVIIPFAENLAKAFPTRRVEARRAWPHLLNTINAVALLRQFQKKVIDGTIVADVEDYRVALEVVRPSLANLRGAIDDGVKRVWRAIQDKAKEGDDFTRTMVAGWSGMRQSDCNGRLRILADTGFIQETVHAKGNQPSRFKVSEMAGDINAADEADLPSAEALAQMLGEGKVSR